ncbi:MAG: (d)CMP kinase [Bdellovibrionales bacterium]
MIVTIDGPAASGKSSVSRELARKLGWSWVSTGAFYRGLGYVASVSDVDIESEESVLKLNSEANWLVVMAPEQTEIHFNNENVSSKVYSEKAGAIASKISQYPRVREALLEPQRQCAESRSLIAEGRDCGSIVFPNADIKIYLTANETLRAARRASQTGDDVETIRKKNEKRDAQDSGRKAAPMQIPDGATVIETSSLSLDEVVNKISTIVNS